MTFNCSVHFSENYNIPNILSKKSNCIVSNESYIDYFPGGHNLSPLQNNECMLQDIILTYFKLSKCNPKQNLVLKLMDLAECITVLQITL